MEDNLYLGRGQMAKCNAELVEKMVKLMELMDFEVATPDEAREILGTAKR
jgi:3-keto-5-aminohexanoate cleavage enzyme